LSVPPRQALNPLSILSGEEPLYVHLKRNAAKENNDNMLNTREGENVTFVSYDTVVEALSSIHDKKAARALLWKNEF
jgi:hypothetical protein